MTRMKHFLDFTAWYPAAMIQESLSCRTRADKQIFLTEEQMKTVVYDSDEDFIVLWVLGWFIRSNKSIGNGSHYIVLVGQEKTKAIYAPSYEMARFFEGIFHGYSIDRGL